MASLDDAPGLTLDGLAGRMGLDEAEAANILMPSLEKGLVTKSADPANPDVTAFKLTEVGLDIRGDSVRRSRQPPTRSLRL